MPKLVAVAHCVLVGVLFFGFWLYTIGELLQGPTYLKRNPGLAKPHFLARLFGPGLALPARLLPRSGFSSWWLLPAVLSYTSLHQRPFLNNALAVSSNNTVKIVALTIPRLVSKQSYGIRYCKKSRLQTQPAKELHPPFQADGFDRP